MKEITTIHAVCAFLVQKIGVSPGYTGTGAVHNDEITFPNSMKITSILWWTYRHHMFAP
jgi:hypothetical protein